MEVSTRRAQKGSWAGWPNERDVPFSPGTGAGRRWTIFAPAASTRSSSTTAASGSASDSIGALRILPSWSKPQSSSSQVLKAVRLAMVASMSPLRASSTPHPRVGKSMIVPRSCSAMTFRRASRSWYSGRSGSTCMRLRGSTPSGIWPRNNGSMQPGTMMGSKVGLGMKS